MDDMIDLNQGDEEEAKVAQLIKNYFADDVRPSEAAERRTWERLACAVRGQRNNLPYPDHLLGVLAVCLVSVVVWFAIQVLDSGLTLYSNPLLMIGFVVVLMNLFALPASVTAIVKSRGKDASS